MHQIFTSEVPNRDRLGDRRISAVLAIGVFVEQVLPMLHGSSMCLPPAIYFSQKAIVPVDVELTFRVCGFASHRLGTCRALRCCRLPR